MLHITNFQNVPSSDVFLIGPYVGSRKPANEDDYMGDFVSELVKLSDMPWQGLYVWDSRDQFVHWLHEIQRSWQKS